MTKSEFEKLLHNSETEDLEWKANWPSGLIGNRQEPNWSTGRGELLKDLVSISNASSSKPAHFIIGVKDLRSQRKVIGISKFFDDADFQQWAKNTFYPSPKFVYEQLSFQNKKVVGIFKIERIPNYPHVVKSSLGGVLYKGQVWFRKGTQNNIALYRDLLDIIKGVEPFKFINLRDSHLIKIKQYYEKKGREVSLPLLEKKDSLLAQGYEIATYPETRREIWVGYHNNRYEHILLLKPNKKDKN